jgi:hypothetical protein
MAQFVPERHKLPYSRSRPGVRGTADVAGTAPSDRTLVPLNRLCCKGGNGVQRMSVLSTIGLWLGVNGAVFAVLAARKPRPGLRAWLFHWVIRNETAERRRSRGRHSHA